VKSLIVTLGLQASSQDFPVPSFLSRRTYLTHEWRGPRDYIICRVKPLHDDDDDELISFGD